MQTKLILEIGCNHNGSMEIAKQMIDEAARLGAWAVKFQKRDIDSIPAGIGAAPRKPGNSFGATYKEHRQALEFSPGQLCELAFYAEKLGIAVGISVFDLPSFKALHGIPLAFVKLPSQFYSNPALNRALLDFAAENECRAFASTGMHSLKEIYNSEHFGQHDVTFYCRSMYPFDAEKANLRVMRELSFALQGRGVLGYSSHDNDGMVIPLAVILGAQCIERHFTLDKAMKGSDHKTVSSTPDEIREIKELIEGAEAMLGNSYRLDDDEIKIRQIYRGF